MRRFLAVLLFGCSAAMAQAPAPMSHHHHPGMSAPAARPAAADTPRRPSEAGQGAFAAIQEIVALLEADPATDWSKVNIEALRRHLIDMDAVTLHAEVVSVPIASGRRFDVTGSGPVCDSIRRMLKAHAATMSGIDGWTFTATEIEGGASLSVAVPAKDRGRLEALGIIGVLTRGMHHQGHHLMLARGQDPHG